MVFVLSFSDNHSVRRGMRLLECSTVLFQAKHLGEAEGGGPRFHGGCIFAHRTLLAIPVQCTDVRMVAVRAVQFAIRKYGHFRSNRDSQSRNGAKAFERLHHLLCVFPDFLLHLFVLVTIILYFL